MNIVVLGAGTVGTSIADILCQKEHSVTVVDTDPVKVRQINEQLDVRAIVGSGSSSTVLFQAGISSADVCLAVTGDDEVNMVSASIAKSMGCRRSLARVYSNVFRDLSTFDYQRHFNIDRMLSLEHLAAMELARQIRDPGSVVVEQFSRGELEVRELIVGQAGKVTSKPLKELGMSPKVRIGTIQRDNRMWIASGTDQCEVGDKVTVFSRADDMKAVKALFNKAEGPTKRVVVAGGGETGFHLASSLEREGFKITVLEIDEARCETLAKHLDAATIINCDAQIRSNLEEERIGTADVFVACTGDDANNLVMAVEALDIGAAKVMSIIGRPDYLKVVSKLGIDLAVSRRDVMSKQILAYLTQGAVVSRAKLPGGLINVIEVEVMEGAPATQLVLAELGLPERCLVVAMIRRDFVKVPSGTDKVQKGDTVILLVEDDVANQAIKRFSCDE